MNKYLLESLSNKFEIKGFQLYFNIYQGELAEILFDSLDRSTEGLKKVFDLEEVPNFKIYLYPDPTDIEKVTCKPLKLGESMRIIPDENTILVAASKHLSNPGEELVKNICYIIFDTSVKEREIGITMLRTPSWLREGLCLQVPISIKYDYKDYAINLWKLCEEALKTDSFIKPQILRKNIYFIPDPNRKSLAIAQSYFMVKLLINNYSDRFFKKYSTLMSAFEDLEAENAFQQITSFDFDKFFTLFKDWVKSTNVWVAISE